MGRGALTGHVLTCPMHIWRADTPTQAYTQAWWMSPTCLKDTPRAPVGPGCGGRPRRRRWYTLRWY